MTREQIQDSLQEISQALHDQFEDEPRTHLSRLEQLDHALATVAMATDALFDEEIREVELARRIVSRAKVHGDNEVHSPNGRPIEHIKIIAGRGK